MKILRNLILIFLMMAPVMLSAHPGHGEFNHGTPLHYFTVEHFYPVVAVAVIIYLGVTLIRWFRTRTYK